jgi:cyclopropane fatty-acyl-phospholipid synthase-like methyltransferase
VETRAPVPTVNSRSTKAEFINSFVTKYGIDTVIEFGCGDGAQLELAQYAEYVGFDVSSNALERCRKRFESDPTKRFALTTAYAEERADLALSLDVVYHLVEDRIYEEYMRLLLARRNVT